MREKLAAVSMAAVMLAVAAVGGTLAYFTDTQSAENVFTVGNVKIELTEPGWEETLEEKANEDVYPGQVLTKDPTVENKGANPCFVRVHVSNLDQFGEKGEITYLTDDVPGALGEGWEKLGDYFYWTEPLASGAITTPVFQQIKMPTGLVGLEETGDIVVTAQAVHAQGASEDGEMPVAGMAAWFTTCGMEDIAAPAAPEAPAD